jgi:nucleotide-binding universal stress UspA family protein
MYRRILVAFDGSPESRLAVAECSNLIQVSGREIHLACVIHDPSPYLLAGEFVPEPALAVDRSRMETDLKEAAGQLQQRGFTVITHLEEGEPVDVIARMCNSLGIDLLILGHRRSKKFAFRWWRSAMDTMISDRVRCTIMIAGDQATAPA